MDPLHALEQWGIKQAVNIALSAMIKDGTITLAGEKTVDQAAEVLTDAIIAEAAKKVSQ